MGERIRHISSKIIESGAILKLRSQKIETSSNFFHIKIVRLIQELKITSNVFMNYIARVQ
ncbi:hypothetical protein SAMN05880501_12311 [Ureibacillus xyleni]|uniref:Uncharacterized protein n=1 Tax=Ureibacillus xyleni TaxID=614648 RepID=A0A285TU47_9BACL|nr:hypothetical protein SAMN05880501_12311 [Ureibacillus xyleni]